MKKTKTAKLDLKEKNKNIVENKVGKLLCIILKEGKGSEWVWLDEHEEKFSVDSNTYFKQDSGTYINGIQRMLVYLEGISLPIHHGYIQHEEIKKVTKDKKTGKTKTVTIKKIKGLKFDSKVIDIILNRNLADEFTKTHMDLPNLMIIVIVIAGLLVGIINIGMWFA